MLPTGLFALVVVSCSSSSLFATGDPPDPLVALNASVRKAYQRARVESLAKLGPVVLVNGDSLVLIQGTVRTPSPIDSSRYHSLKTVAHAALGVFLILNGYDLERLPQPQQDELRQLRSLIPGAKAALAKYEFTDEQRRRQERILSECDAFINDVLFWQRSDPKELTEFCRKMRPLVLANAADAAKDQIDAFHKQMCDWKKQLTADEWRKLRVVIQGSQMPRKGNLAVQYFAKLLAESGEGPRIIYAEGLFETQSALNLLGTHILDSRVAQSFFNDSRRMDRDLLSDAASEYLKKLVLD
jgi:hypothetical protein